MGVPGLWDIVRPAAQSHTLANLAVESGFTLNIHGNRAYHIGIDVSIWLYHARSGREGENPELRTLFFRCCRLMAIPLLPIFIFDGPKRPRVKRGKAVGGHWIVNDLRAILDAFGFEYRTAPGEAEAELAYLNRIGVIDAVLSDDVDCFLFGAHTVIRNSSPSLSGNRAHDVRNAEGREDGQHASVYHAEELASHTQIGLSKGGLILIALLCGGDYDQRGIVGCGMSTAHALARAGFGDSLLSAVLSSPPAALTEFLLTWRASLRDELRANVSGFALRKHPSLAQRIPEDFPPLDVLRCYTNPVTSETDGVMDFDGLWMKEPDLARIARVCEQFFEWGIEVSIMKRFRSVLWPGAVLRSLLHAALDKDMHTQQQQMRPRVGSPTGRGPCGPGVESPSKVLAHTLDGIALHAETDQENENKKDLELITFIYGQRRHASTDYSLEYRLEIHPTSLVARAKAGIQGTRTKPVDSTALELFVSDSDNSADQIQMKRGPKAPPIDPNSSLRVWMPAVMVEYVYPRLIEDFQQRHAVKLRLEGKGKGKRGSGRAEPGTNACPSSSNGITQAHSSAGPTQIEQRPVKRPLSLAGGEEERDIAVSAQRRETAKSEGQRSTASFTKVEYSRPSPVSRKSKGKASAPKRGITGAGQLRSKRLKVKTPELEHN